MPLRIAIIGGGLAGAALLRALLHQPVSHLDVHIFESAPAFKEAGAAIGIGGYAQAALDLMGAETCLARAGAVALRGLRFMLARGPYGGTVLDEINETSGRRLNSIVHRAAFLRELLDGVPAEQMHTGKRLERVERKGVTEGEGGGSDDRTGSLVLHFADGSTHECDVLVGADGLHSFVRKLILGADDPAVTPRNTGWWTVWLLKPYAEARASLGHSLVDIDDARQYIWLGSGACILHDVLQEGELAQFILVARDPEVSDKKEPSSEDRGRRTVSADEMRRVCADWLPHLRQAVENLLCNQPEQPAIYLREHPPARSYVDDAGAVCVVGDAAHTTTPWQGAGGGMSIEDAFVLASLLGRAHTPADARVALRVYDTVRRPRTQRIVASSRETAEIQAGLSDGVGIEEGKLTEMLSPRWDFIVNFDVEKQRDEAVRMMEEHLGRTGGG